MLTDLAANTSERDRSLDRSVEDSLPPFAALTTDEEREKKAELRNPGTYHVVVNPRSFVSLSEYVSSKPFPRQSSQKPRGRQLGHRIY